MQLTAETIRKLGLKQRFICDIGVHRGTPWLYKAFPDIPFVLVDPVDEPMDVTPRHVEARYRCAAGSAETTGSIKGQRAMRQVIEGPGAVEVRTTEDILSAHKGRFGLAVNAEGWDADIIAGLGERRDDMAWCVVEVPLREDLFERGRASDVFEVLGHDFQPRAVFPCHWKHHHYCAMLFLPSGDERLKI